MSIQPCPFCGDPDPAIDEIDMGIFAIVCNDCMTIGPHQNGTQSAEEAINKWNLRARTTDNEAMQPPAWALEMIQGE